MNNEDVYRYCQQMFDEDLTVLNDTRFKSIIQTEDYKTYENVVIMSFQSWLYARYSTLTASSSTSISLDNFASAEHLAFLKKSFNIHDDLYKTIIFVYENFRYLITLISTGLLNYSERNRKFLIVKQNEMIESFNTNIETIDTKINKLKTKTKKLKSDINTHSQKSAESNITILGIFVGIVMTFFGGFSILDHSITSMENASPYRLYFTMMVFGAILYNIVILMFFLISRIVRKPITCACHYYKREPSAPVNAESDKQESKNNTIAVEDDTNNFSYDFCNNCVEKKHLGMCRVKHIFPHVYWGNLVILAILIFIFVLYFISGGNEITYLEVGDLFVASLPPACILWLGYDLPTGKRTKKFLGNCKSKLINILQNMKKNK